MYNAMKQVSCMLFIQMVCHLLNELMPARGSLSTREVGTVAPAEKHAHNLLSLYEVTVS